MIRRIALTAVLWIVALYTAQAGTLFFDGEAGSGGDPKGHAENISCSHNWWAFGALWSCDATIVADDGKRYPYSNRKSILTPADVGKRVPMTNNRVRSGRSSQASMKWALAERREPNKVAYMSCLMGIPVVALYLTFRMFREKNPVK